MSQNHPLFLLKPEKLVLAQLGEMVRSSPACLLHHDETLTGIPTGGHLRPSVYARLSRYIKEFGLTAAVEVADFEFDHIKAIADLIEKEKIECEFALCRSYDIYTDQAEADDAKREYLELKSAGVCPETMDDVVFYEGEEARKVSFLSFL